MPAVLSYPNINGVYPDWARVKLNILGLPSLAGIPTKGFQALRYTQDSDGELSMGNSQLPNGQTTGMIKPGKGSITMLLPEGKQLLAAIGAPQGAFGSLTTLFNLMVQYGGVDGTGVPYIITDMLFGTRIVGTANEHRQAGGALTMTFPIQPVYIVENGVFPDDADDYQALVAAYQLLLNAV